MDLFVIDFNETASHEMIFCSLIFSYCNNLTKSSRDNALGILAFSSHHSVSLTATCLSIGEDGAIVPV